MKWIEIAKSYLNCGYYNNSNLFNEWFYGRSVSGDAFPWCMTFVSYCLAQAGYDIKYASVIKFYSFSKHRLNDVPCIGDIFIELNSDGIPFHVGFVTDIKDDTFITVEGNMDEVNKISKIVSKTREIKPCFLFYSINDNNYQIEGR